jgi:hypothetical protein
VDSTGKITYAPANLLLQSQTFDNASWGKTSTTVTADATTAPDGTPTADKLISNNGVSISATNITQTITAATATYTYSIYAKKAEFNRLNLVVRDDVSAGNNAQVTVSLEDGSVTAAATAGGTFTGASATVSSAANGFYRVALTFTSTGATALRVRVFPNDSVATTGNGTSGIFIWGAQLEPVTYQTTPSTYVATTSAAYYGPRFDYDPVTLAAKGLLIEEQRVNLVTYSEQFNNAAWSKSNVTVTADTTVAPDGTTTADTLTASTAAAFTWQVISFTGDGDKTMSCFVKAGTAATSVVQIRDATVTANRGYFIITWTAGVPSVAPLTTGTVLGVDAFGNGWYRLRLLATGVVAANSNQYRFLPDTTSGTGTVIAWGAQAENGSFATSYIPTVASTVTRSADVATMTGTNFSSWYNQSAGTFVADFDKYSTTQQGGVVSAGSTVAVSATAICLDGHNDGKIRAYIENGGVVELANVTLANYTANTPIKAAIAYATNNAVGAAAGALGTVDTSVVVPTVDTFTIGNIRNSTGAPTTPLNGHIRQIAYYNTRLSDATLQALTA